MRYQTLALLGIIASAAALALLAGFATTQSPLSSFYATGTAQAVSEPIDVKVIGDLQIKPAAGAQGKTSEVQWLNITKYTDVNVVKLKVKIANAAQLKPYFKYLRLVLKSADSNEVKAVLSLKKPSAVIVLDEEDFSTNAGNANDCIINVTAYYEAKEGMLFDSLPVILNFQVLSVS
ncbi:hypothetical protein [Pyrodictium abyssi]|uniref:Type VI secretion system tube protein Hcp n=1 Tax=Pyrodictium abyssi TaxID=54256 RepID=A0ABM8IZY1_9CREN|nr:hypothetical protein PABY_14980 [Pyrodictium abyssi]